MGIMNNYSKQDLFQCLYWEPAIVISPKTTFQGHVIFKMIFSEKSVFFHSSGTITAFAYMDDENTCLRLV